MHPTFYIRFAKLDQVVRLSGGRRSPIFVGHLTTPLSSWSLWVDLTKLKVAAGERKGHRWPKSIRTRFLSRPEHSYSISSAVRYAIKYGFIVL